MVLAVLQGRAGLPLGEKEIYLSTVGGMKVTEPAADLGIALAVNSLVTNKPTPRTTVAIGEVGLAGEVRRVSAVGRRVAEAKRLGFTHAIIPAGSDDPLPKGIRVTRVSGISDAISAVTIRDVSRAPF